MTRDEVYRPREDSYLLAEAALEYCTAGDTVVDVGSGTGFVGGQVQDEIDCNVIGTDISRYSAIATYERGLQSTVGDLVKHFSDSSIDIALFNPPYIHAQESVDKFDDRALSYEDIQLFDYFLSDLDRVLKHNGSCLLLLSSRSQLTEIESTITDIGFSIDTVKSKELFRETLYVKHIS